MTVSTTDNEVVYVSGGPAFPIPYRFLQNADIQAVLVKQDGTSETLTGAQYTLSGAGSQSGGTLTSSYAAGVLATPGASLTISRVMDAVQPTDLRNQGKYLAETHENVFDRLTMLIQQGFSGLSRALRRPIGKSYYDAEGHLISNVADPVSDQDAATKGWAGRYFGDLIDAATGLINTTIGILYDAGTLFDHLRFGVYRTVDTVAALRLLSGARNQRAFVLGYYAKGDGGGGEYFIDPADTVTADNGGSVIVGADGSRWHLVPRHGRIAPEQFGAFPLSSPSVTTDATANFQAMLATGYIIQGTGETYNATPSLVSGTAIINVKFQNVPWRGTALEFQHHQPVITIDGTVSPKTDIYLEDVWANGRREIFDNITSYFGEDGGMHAIRIVGDVKRVHGLRVHGYNAGTAGICTHHPTPSATVTEYKLQDIVFIDSQFTGNREHGWFGGSLAGVKFIRPTFTGNGLDIDASKPLEHGLRGATTLVGGVPKYFGGPFDIEGYAVGSGVNGVLIEDADCRGNSQGALIVDETPSTATGFQPRTGIKIRGGYYDAGITPLANSADPDAQVLGVKFPIKIKGNWAGGAKPYADIELNEVFLVGPLYLNGFSNFKAAGGFINAITRCAFAFNFDHVSITSPCLNNKIDLGGIAPPGSMTFSKISGAAGAALTITQELIRTLPDGSYEINGKGSLTGGAASGGALVYSAATASGYLVKSIIVTARVTSTGKPVPCDSEVDPTEARFVIDSSADTTLTVNMTCVIAPRLG